MKYWIGWKTFFYLYCLCLSTCVALFHAFIRCLMHNILDESYDDCLRLSKKPKFWRKNDTVAYLLDFSIVLEARFRMKWWYYRLLAGLFNGSTILDSKGSTWTLQVLHGSRDTYHKSVCIGAYGHCIGSFVSYFNMFIFISVIAWFARFACLE